MKKDTIITAKTIALAVEAGAAELGVTADKVTYTVLEEPKKGILGIGASGAIVKVCYDSSPADNALNFITTLLDNMGYGIKPNLISETEAGASISINGDGLGLLIGRHGEVLDAIQHLANLIANKETEEHYRISLDIEKYREKRVETLKGLAERMASKVLKYNRSFALEPMNAYERRIIHEAVQSIEGVTTYSVGNDNERKVVIAPEKKRKTVTPQSE